MENHQNTGTIVIAAVRYAMGRRTYIVGVTIEWVKEFWGKLSDGDRGCISRDVKSFVEGEESNGDQCDKKRWENFHHWTVNNKLEGDTKDA